jgi:hypothetical protein
MRFEEFADCQTWWAKRIESERAWRVPIADIEASGYNLDLRNPHRPDDLTHRPTAELLAELVDTEREILALLEKLEGELGWALPDPEDGDEEAGLWRQVRLGSAMQPAIERVTVQANRSYPNVGVYSFGRGLFEKPEIDGATTAATTLNRIKAGQFIYSRLFAFEGAYAYVPSHFDGYYVSGEFPAFDTDPEQLDARWLAAYLASPDRWADLAGRSKGLGVRRQRVPVEAVMNYEVWLPPIAKQRAMVGTIDSLDRVRAARRGADKRFDALLPAALNEAFESFSRRRASGLPTTT